VAKLPNPPAPEQLAQIRPSYQKLLADTLLWRVYFTRAQHPGQWNSYRFVGPTTARFDHHLLNKARQPHAQSRGIHYAALDGIIALAEVFQTTRVINRSAKGPWMVAYRPQKSLQLLDLSGAFATHVGASMLISSGPRTRARRWSQAFYEAYPHIDGLYYESSMHGGHYCVALYERTQNDVLPPHPAFHRALNDPTIIGLLRQAADRLNYSLI
jgi:hypothetical protein